MMQKIYLIRHGATVANTQHLYCGRSDLPLCPEGRDALHRLRAAGGYPEPAGCRVCISGMLRTRQTLEALYGPLEAEVLSDFREIDFGAFELQSYEQLKEREDYQQWISGDNARNRCPGGESGEDVAARVLPAFEALAADGRDTVLITHGGVIAAILADLYPESENSRYEWQPEPGHGWAVTLEQGKPVKCEPIPDAFLGRELPIPRVWAWISAGLLALGVVSLLLAAASAMNQTGHIGLWLAVMAALVVLSQVFRVVKLRCPYCRKSVAPMRLLGDKKMVCPRCGRIYRYSDQK